MNMPHVTFQHKFFLMCSITFESVVGRVRVKEAELQEVEEFKLFKIQKESLVHSFSQILLMPERRDIG